MLLRATSAPGISLEDAVTAAIAWCKAIDSDDRSQAALQANFTNISTIRDEGPPTTVRLTRDGKTFTVNARIDVETLLREHGSH